MEKFCIVKRRKQSLQDPFPSLLPIPEEEPGIRHNNFPPPQEINSWKEPVLSLSLTPWQSRIIQTRGILPLLEKETPINLNLTLHQEENRPVIFNFHLDLDHNLTMFKSHQVCRMMQISRTLLNRMVQENKIKSYKIGRLRRFSLKDIIEALSQSLAGNSVCL